MLTILQKDVPKETMNKHVGFLFVLLAYILTWSV